MTTLQEVDGLAASQGATLSADKIEMTKGKCERDIGNGFKTYRNKVRGFFFLVNKSNAPKTPQHFSKGTGLSVLFSPQPRDSPI